MKLSFQASSLGAPRHLPASCALLAPKPALPFQPHFQLSLVPLQITTKPILPSLFPSPALVPDASRITPTAIEYA
jgi:hypothetical protein